MSKKKKGKRKAVKSALQDQPLRHLTQQALATYFRTLIGPKPSELYDLVISEVEQPLLEAVLEYTDGNQCRAADILGINRGTLRKKLKTYNLLG